jgi:ubiquinone/menaquinone biosynthesis C-methylase UbiE
LYILSLSLVEAFLGPTTRPQTHQVSLLWSSTQLDQEQYTTVAKESATTTNKPVEKRNQPTSFLTPLDNSPSLELPPDTERPGRVEDDKFNCDSSVDFWKGFASEGNSKNWYRVRAIVAKHVFDTSPESRAYWVSHVLRTTYFLSNGIFGLVGHDLHERFIADGNSQRQTEKKDSRLGMLLNSNSDVGTRLLLEVMLCYEQDWANVQNRRIKFPWDAFVRQTDDNSLQIQTNHKQFNPFFVLQESSRLVRESIGVFGRQNKFGGKPSGIWINQQKASKISYPDYFLNDFHYQTDGWMSTASAERYEVSTETLFLGRQDTMQRQTLLPLQNHFGGSEPQTLLEVACGTGRFATFTRDNFRSTNVTLTDLSPFYLEKARRNDDYWRKYQQVDKQATPTATFVQANAEDLPFEDNSFDAVTCVYLFHELPETARAQAAAEMSRVVKPGGILVLTDSCQLGDRPPMDESIGRFSNLNEPHYQNYIRTEIAPLFTKHGLVCHEKYVASSTKTLSFIKKEM